MIARFKIFESKIYRIGEYIKVTNKYFIDKSLNYFAKIIEIDNSELPYLVIFSNNMNMWIDEDTIIRNLTLEEIEQYELELTSKKYNL
jgi:hypothetical protein